ncbi:MAG TPA: hypothetical protein VKY92_27040 [Verrucomicrobiae bacterium]|jgi:hypothetical protein|nr:hypothetical protein [Verrucomicrobiae bacterium]
MRRFRGWLALLLAVVGFDSSGQRINQEGRILGPAAVVTNSVLFNTPEADAILSAMQIFPVTSAWNEDISRLPLLPNSDAMISQISADLLSSRRTLRAFQEMNFVLVPDSQPLVPINFVDYPDESDPSPYPIPANMPIETWPTGTGLLTLQQWQQDINNTGGDRHSIVVEPGNGFIWETWQALLAGTNWQASNGAKFDLNSNAMRPAGWTSGDAAGLPMFPALPRYDECERGMVEHACRIVVYRSRKEYLYPANHYASSTPATQTNVPAMGQRLRLKSGFVIPSTWSTEEKAILLGLKKYGAIVADNGNFFSISVTPDDRWPANAFNHISSVGITNFEVVQGTGPTQGPRSPGAPLANAGADMSVPLGSPVALQGWVGWTNVKPAVTWKLYSGPGNVAFTNPIQTNTPVTFSAPGRYTLMLSASDGVHAVAYSAVNVVVTQALTVAVMPGNKQVGLSWAGGSPPYIVDQSSLLVNPSWVPVLTNSTSNAVLSIKNSAMFFRVRCN